MMAPVPATFDACLDFVWGPGRDGQRDDRAPGESFATAYGVTQASWDHAVQDGVVQGDLADATREQCAAVLRAYYWNALHCSALPAGVSLVVFNDGVLAGAGHTARLLQHVVGAAQDGVIGPETLRLAASFGDRRLIDALVAADEAFFASLHNAPLFLRGWTRREEEARQLAYRMAGLGG